MTDLNRRRPATWIACLALMSLVGCASTKHQAPVEDRSTGNHPSVKVVEAPKAPSPSASAPVEVKPGSYVVKAGDTLMRIALDNGQGWRDIARWNNIENPNLIEVGQVLRVVPPGAGETVAVSKPVSSTKVDAKPLDPKAASAAASANGAAAAASSAASSAPPAPVPAPREGDDDVQWAWPAAGPVVSPFDDARSKGLGIGGKAGDAVLAAADGRVVYAGSGLRGYGNLVIVKHNATYLTAYAHNQTLLVKEDQAVRKGQKIAEMGSSDADRVKLHFEIRRQGKPIDPAKLLPSR
jgi:lipoprotein NlpD